MNQQRLDGALEPRGPVEDPPRDGPPSAASTEYDPSLPVDARINERRRRWEAERRRFEESRQERGGPGSTSPPPATTRPAAPP